MRGGRAATPGGGAWRLRGRRAGRAACGLGRRRDVAGATAPFLAPRAVGRGVLKGISGSRTTGSAMGAVYRDAGPSSPSPSGTAIRARLGPPSAEQAHREVARQLQVAGRRHAHRSQAERQVLARAKRTVTGGNPGSVATRLPDASTESVAATVTAALTTTLFGADQADRGRRQRDAEDRLDLRCDQRRGIRRRDRRGGRDGVASPAERDRLPGPAAGRRRWAP